MPLVRLKFIWSDLKFGGSFVHILLMSKNHGSFILAIPTPSPPPKKKLQTTTTTVFPLFWFLK